MSKTVTMPALSPTMQSGNLAKWLVSEGDSVRSGDVIAEIETDKSVMELESNFSGTIHKFLVAAGTRDVPVNTPIAVILEAGEKAEDIANNETLSAHAGAVERLVLTEKIDERSTEQDNKKNAKSSVSKKDGKSVKSQNRVKASPVAKKIAEESKIDLSKVRGTGPDDRVIKSDVMGAMNNNDVVAHSTRQDEKIPTNNMRRIIAAKLLESKTTIPHFYLQIDCILDHLLKARETLNEQGKDKLTVNDFVMKASALALRDNADMNASWGGDFIVRYGAFNVCVAVAIDGGLVTPVIRNADTLSIYEISAATKAVAAKARSGKIMPEDLMGGTFTVSNLGMYGISSFNAIINPPQSAILAVGAGEQRVVVVNGNMTIANVMSVTLSVDHRVVDGALGAKFLASFKKYIENPVLMFTS